MQSNRLGTTDLTVTRLAFGTDLFGWVTDERTAFSLLDAYAAAGGNFIDTADIYGAWPPNDRGESEIILGKWMAARGNRPRMVIATKVGMSMGAGREGLAPGYIRAAVDASLQRLQTDYIDVYQSHTDDRSTPLEDTMLAFSDLARAGKVRVVGASNYQSERLREAAGVSHDRGFVGYRSLQTAYNLCDRAAVDEELRATCEHLGLGLLASFALAGGFLSARYRSRADLRTSSRGRGIAHYLNERGLRILDAVDRAAQRHNCSPAQVALAWVIAQPGINSALASASTVEQLEQLIAAVDLRLDQEALADLEGNCSESRPCAAAEA